MDHQQVERNHLVDRYLAGELAEEEEVAFEEHLLECPACLEEARLGEDFRASLKGAVAEDVARARAAARLGLLARLWSHPLLRRGLLTGLILALATLPAWLVHRSAQQQLREEGRRFAQQNEDLRRKLEAPSGPGASAEELAAVREQVAALEESLAAAEAEKGRLEASWQEARQERAALTTRLEEMVRPRGDSRLVSLGVVRSGGAGEEEETVVSPEPGGEWLVLSVELPAVEYPAYAVELRSDAGELAEGKLLWRGEGLTPNLYDSLLITLHSSFLAPGSYRLVILGQGEDPETATGEVRLRVGGS